MSTVRRANRQSAAREQRRGARVQKRLGAQPESRPPQGDQEAPREGERSYLYVVDETPLDEVYAGQLDDVVVAYQNAIAPLKVKKAKPPKGCRWDVSRDKTTVTLRAVEHDGGVRVELSGDYCNVKTGEWRDPQGVVERLAMVILFGEVLQVITANKSVGPDPEL